MKLEKPGKLTESEFEIMKLHPEIFDLFLKLREPMSEIAFDFSNPVGDEFESVEDLIEKTKHPHHSKRYRFLMNSR